jgi:hypothetical protein
MIALGNEPEGLLVRRSEVFAWLPGLSKRQWRKFHACLTPHYVPGGHQPSYAGQKPLYAKAEIKAKLVQPLTDGNKQ